MHVLCLTSINETSLSQSCRSFSNTILFFHDHFIADLSKQEANNIEIQRALATLGRTYFIKALSHTNNRERQKSLQNSYDYYLKSEETCDILIGVSSQDLAVMKARLYLNIGLTLESMGKFCLSL